MYQIFGKRLFHLFRLVSGRSTADNAFDSMEYWENRYLSGQSSGVGSYGKFALFKAEIINAFVKRRNIGSVVEFGCGDGNQLSLFTIKNYVGVDSSKAVVDLCRKRFLCDSTKTFFHVEEFVPNKYEMTTSLDVIYHLVEESVYEQYMSRLFDCATNSVTIYSSNYENPGNGSPKHVRHRRFTDWVELNRKGWKLIQRVPNKYPYEGDYTEGSWSDFYFFQKETSN